MARAIKAAGERGQALISLALALAVVCGMVALTIDIGLLFMERRGMQNAADAAALAGAQELPDSPPQAIAVARQWGQKHGFVDGVGGVSVSVTTPYQGDPTKIRVDISGDTSATFARVLGIDSFQVSGGATADQEGGPGAYALIVLNKTKCLAFDNTGSGNIQISGGGIMVNSGCSNAARHAGSGNIEVSAVHYYQAGGFVVSGSGNVSPPPQPVASQVADPLASWAPPAPGAASPGSAGTPSNPQLTLVNGSGNKTLYPGTYYGGLKITGSGNVALQPGTYIMAGGGLEIDASGNVTGADTMFYNTNDPSSPVGAGAHSRIKIASSGNLALAAPTTGAYARMLFWQDPANTQVFSHTGSGNIGTGIVYLPSARLDEAGSGNLGSVQIIVDEYDKSGSGNLEMVAGGWVGQASIIRLVE